MSKTMLKTISGSLLVFLGTCHQAAHFMFEINPEKPKIIFEMMVFEIEMMGKHTLLEFHNGFSLMTGHFLMSIGILVLLLRKKSLGLTVDITFVVIIASICVLSMVYFHPLAYGISGLSAVFYWGAIYKSEA